MAQGKKKGLDALQAGEKLARLKSLIVELQKEIPADTQDLQKIQKLAEELNKEILNLDVRVAPKLVGKDAALLPVMY